MPPTTFLVTANEATQTLVSALRTWLPGRSWTEIRKLIAARRVMVNRALALDETRRLTIGEAVVVADHPQAPPPRDADVKVEFLDDDLIVVRKPAGMTTLRHATERAWSAERRAIQPTLDEVAARLVSGVQRAGRRSVYAVHRLDRETSGLLVFARTPAVSEALIKQFSAHTVRRVYQSLVIGHPTDQRIATRLVRDRGDGLRGSTSDPRLGKPAITHFRTLEQIGPYSLLECRLETGRTHQIRIHLSELGHPVCGETKYIVADDDTSRAPRLALHAAELGFAHPRTGQQMHFTMPLPADLDRFLARLRLMTEN